MISPLYTPDLYPGGVFYRRDLPCIFALPPSNGSGISKREFLYRFDPCYPDFYPCRYIGYWPWFPAYAHPDLARICTKSCSRHECFRCNTALFFSPDPSLSNRNLGYTVDHQLGIGRFTWCIFWRTEYQPLYTPQQVETAFRTINRCNDGIQINHLDIAFNKLIDAKCLAQGTQYTYVDRSIDMKNYIEMYQHLENRIAQLGGEIPLPMGGFARLHKKAMDEGALSRKVKELIALAISITVGCDGCIAYHTHDAVDAGASRQELLETIAVGVLMGGGPGSIYAAQALDALDQFLPNSNGQDKV